MITLSKTFDKEDYAIDTVPDLLRLLPKELISGS